GNARARWRGRWRRSLLAVELLYARGRVREARSPLPDAKPREKDERQDEEQAELGGRVRHRVHADTRRGRGLVCKFGYGAVHEKRRGCRTPRVFRGIGDGPFPPLLNHLVRADEHAGRNEAAPTPG